MATREQGNVVKVGCIKQSLAESKAKKEGK